MRGMPDTFNGREGKNFRPNDVALMKRRFSNRIWG